MIRKECCDRALVRRVEKKRLEMPLWLTVLVDLAKELGSHPRIDTVIPVSEDPVPSSNLYRHQACMGYTHTKTFIHIK